MAGARPDLHLVDPTKVNEAGLLPAVTSGQFVMLYGARGLGKTTRVMHLTEQLKQKAFCPLFVPLLRDVRFDSATEFWSSFGAALRAESPDHQLPALSSASDFGALFSPANQNHYLLSRGSHHRRIPYDSTRFLHSSHLFPSSDVSVL